jgi:hypothetical protein
MGSRYQVAGIRPQPTHRKGHGTVLDFLQPIFPFAFAILWFGPLIVLFFHNQLTYGAYLRQFPPDTLDTTLPEVRGFLDTFAYRRAYRERSRRIVEAERLAPPVPERERLRKAAVHSGVLLLVWGFGFPLVTCGVVGLLTVVGLVHPR